MPSLHEKIEGIAQQNEPTTPAPETEPTAAAVPPEGQAAATEAEVPSFQPDYKFKAMDKEHELDEWVRPFVTDEEKQKKIKEVFQKAYGLDHVKSRNENLSQKINGYETGLRDILDTRDKDFWRFLEKTGVKRETAIKAVLELVEREELPPAHKNLYNEIESLKRDLEKERTERSSLSSNYENQVLQTREMDLAREMTSPKLNSYIDSFDRRMGDGAFRQMVIQQGDYVWQTEKKDLSATEAVQRVLNILGHTVQGDETLTPNELNDQKTPRVGTHKKPIVMPNIGTGSASASGKSPRSLKELRALGKESAG